MRRAKNKSNENFNYRWPNLFNAIIENLELRKIEMVGRQFTWANDLAPPTFKKLDRVLMSSEWEFNFLTSQSRRLIDLGLTIRHYYLMAKPPRT
jgi:hypothetical protein